MLSQPILMESTGRRASRVIHNSAVFTVTSTLRGIHTSPFSQLISRCTSCQYDFERNYHTRQDFLHVHDHSLGDCSRCGSKRPSHYKGTPGDLKMKSSKWGGIMVGTRDVNCGIK